MFAVCSYTSGYEFSIPQRHRSFFESAEMSVELMVSSVMSVELMVSSEMSVELMVSWEERSLPPSVNKWQPKSNPQFQVGEFRAVWVSCSCFPPLSALYDSLAHTTVLVSGLTSYSKLFIFTCPHLVYSTLHILSVSTVWQHVKELWGFLLTCV